MSLDSADEHFLALAGQGQQPRQLSVRLLQLRGHVNDVPCPARLALARTVKCQCLTPLPPPRATMGRPIRRERARLSLRVADWASRHRLNRGLSQTHHPGLSPSGDHHRPFGESR